MKEENRKYAEEAYSIVRHAAEKIGSRLPGSDGERKFADYMGDKLKEIGITPKKRSLRFRRARPSAAFLMPVGSALP